MVILDKDSIIEAHPMVTPSAHSDGVFLQQTQSRSCFSGIDNNCISSFNSSNILPGECGDAGQSLDQVQRDTLSR